MHTHSKDLIDSAPNENSRAVSEFVIDFGDKDSEAVRMFDAARTQYYQKVRKGGVITVAKVKPILDLTLQNKLIRISSCDGRCLAQVIGHESEWTAVGINPAEALGNLIMMYGTDILP